MKTIDKTSVVMECIRQNINDTIFINWLYRILECEGAEE